MWEPATSAYGHKDDLAVAGPCRIEVVLRNARAEGGDHANGFSFVRQHLS